MSFCGVVGADEVNSAGCLLPPVEERARRGCGEPEILRSTGTGWRLTTGPAPGNRSPHSMQTFCVGDFFGSEHFAQASPAEALVSLTSGVGVGVAVADGCVMACCGVKAGELAVSSLDGPVSTARREEEGTTGVVGADCVVLVLGEALSLVVGLAVVIVGCARGLVIGVVGSEAVSLPLPSESL